MRINYEYPCCPGEPWPIAAYTIHLRRAGLSFYVLVSILPGIAITMLSFATAIAPLLLLPPPLALLLPRGALSSASASPRDFLFRPFGTATTPSEAAAADAAAVVARALGGARATAESRTRASTGAPTCRRAN